MFELIIFGFLLVIVVGIFLLIVFKRSRELTTSQKKLLLAKFIIIKKIKSQKEKLIDLDKLYHIVLKQLGYRGSFGEILKSNPKQIRDINKIWKLHKLRNYLVHELDSIDKKILEKSTKDYEREIEIFLK